MGMTERDILFLILNITAIGFIIYISTSKKDRSEEKIRDDSWIDEREEIISKTIQLEKEVQELNVYIHKKAGERLTLENNLKELHKNLNQLRMENISLKQKLSNLSPSQLEVTLPITKECPACKRVQPLGEFNKNQNQPDGLTKWCSKCLIEGAPMPNDTSGTKICEKCHQNRRKTSFYPSSKYRDGLSKWCKFCLDKH